MEGKYIIIEGPDGAGKDSLINGLAKSFTLLGKSYSDFRKEFRKSPNDIILISEPSALKTGQRVRELIKQKASTEELARAFSDDRKNLIKNYIQPWLEMGKIIISGRSFISSLVYQGHLINIDHLLNLEGNKVAVENGADEIIIITSPLEQLIKRINIRNNSKEFFEKKDFLKNVLNIYKNEKELMYKNKNLTLQELIKTLMPKTEIIYFDNSGPLEDLKKFSKETAKILLSN